MTKPNDTEPERDLDLEAPEADAAEQRRPVHGDPAPGPGALIDPDLDLEAPEADAAEQHTPVRDQEHPLWPERIPLDADEADVADQSRIVENDEDDYR